MSFEAVKLVLSAEETAHLAVLDANKNALASVEEAKKAGMEKVASTLARAESEIAHLVRLSDQKATQQAQELASSTANRLATLRVRAERRLQSAAQLIFERIVNL